MNFAPWKRTGLLLRSADMISEWIFGGGLIQVNLCQKLLFLHQLTHKDCSLNYEFRTWKLQAQNMLCTQIVFCFCFCFDIQNNLCTQHVLSLQFSYTELVIQWTIFCHNCGLVDARISASEKDLPVFHAFWSWNCECRAHTVSEKCQKKLI